MSALPRAVQAQLDAAEALQAQLAQPAPVEGTPAGTPGPSEPVVQPAEPAPQPTQTTNSVPEDTWEQRYHVLRGKFDSEVPRLHTQVKELTERLEHAVKTMEAKATPAPEVKKLVTDADVEQFGADLVDMARRVSREEFETLSKLLVDTLEKRFGDVTAKVERTEQQVVKSAADKFWESVVKDHPDFEAVNNDPRWFAFLDSRITGTRFTRRQVAEDAIKALDAVAFNEQLKAFKDSVGIGAQATPPKKPDLNRQVAPNSSRASTPSEPGKKIWSGQEYAAALDHRNLQRMSREDYDKLVAEAELALAEGRVQF